MACKLNGSGLPAYFKINVVIYVMYAINCKWVGDIAVRTRIFHEHTELETWYVLVRGSPTCRLFMHRVIHGLR